MSLIQVLDASVEFAGKQVLKNINCTLEHNSRVGLIGNNGSGKTTLIKLMLGFLRPTNGVVHRAKKCHIAYLAQNMTSDPSITLYQNVSSARGDIQSLKLKIADLSMNLKNEHNESVEEQLSKDLERYQALGGDEFENEMKYVCSSLGFAESDYPKEIGQFSGGEQTRICLAAILLTPYDLLILDEPTNHLDIAMIDWLEKYLVKSGKPYLVVSHDRNFLDNTVHSIYNLREAMLSITKGNYSSFSEADAIARMAQERQFVRQQKLISNTQDFIARNIAGQKTNQAKSRLKMLSRMEIIQRPHHAKQVKLNIQSTTRSGNNVFVLENVDFGIGDNRILAKGVTLIAHYQDRICVIGPNGCGKTTLLRILLDDKDITSGILKIGASLDVAYYDQHQIALDESLTVLETLWQIVPEAPRGYVLSWLARFGFRDDEVDKQVSILSGGEKSRLYLCVLIHQQPNLLIMDEPTNHLDIAMSDELLRALKDFHGTIIFVSHDRYFISQLATKYWVFHRAIADNALFPTISQPDMTMDEAISLAFTVPELDKAPPPQRERRRKRNPWYLEQIHKDIESHNMDLRELMTELDSVHQQLAIPETYTDSKLAIRLQDEMLNLENAISLCRERISVLETKYLEMSYDE